MAFQLLLNSLIFCCMAVFTSNPWSVLPRRFRSAMSRLTCATIASSSASGSSAMPRKGSFLLLAVLVEVFVLVRLSFLISSLAMFSMLDMSVSTEDFGGARADWRRCSCLRKGREREKRP